MQATMIAKGQVRNPVRKVGWKTALGMGQVMARETTMLMEPSTWPWIMLVIKRLRPNGTTGMGTW
jgi:hypothetical protein